MTCEEFRRRDGHYDTGAPSHAHLTTAGRDVAIKLLKEGQL